MTQAEETYRVPSAAASARRRTREKERKDMSEKEDHRKDEYTENREQDRAIADRWTTVAVLLGCRSPSAEFFALKTFDFMEH